jgi:hypothetical protein
MALVSPTFKLLLKQGFSPPIYVEGIPSLSLLFPDAKRPGIYVLHFADGARYVGKSVEVTKRFVQHLATYQDIMAISFAEVPEKDLTSKEREVIAGLESLGVRLRNIQYASFTATDTTFREIMSPADQECWLTDTTYVSQGGQRDAFEVQRAKYESKYMRWLKTINVSEVSSFLGLYIRTAIPTINLTEGSYWAISCLAGRRSEWRANCRVNLHWQEVCCVWRDSVGHGAYFQMALSPLKQAYGGRFLSLKEQFSGIEIYRDAIYSPGGKDQVRIVLRTLNQAELFLALVPVIASLRRFNLSLIRKGPSNWAAMHCPQIVDMCLKA